MWDGIDYAGDRVANGQYLFKVNGGGEVYSGALLPDQETPVLSDVSVTTGPRYTGPHKLSFEFADGDTYSGIVRASVRPLGVEEWEPIIEDEFKIDTYGPVPPIEASFWVEWPGSYEVRLLVWDVGGQHNATTVVPVNIFPAGAVEAVEEAPGLRVRAATTNPSTGEARWNLEGVARGAVEVKIATVDGREVRSWRENSRDGAAAVSWNGCNALGQRVASGWYYLAIRDSEGRRAQSSTVLLR